MRLLPQAGWNPVRLKPSDFTNVYGEALDDWHRAISVTFADGESVANEKKRLLPRAGDKGVANVPTEVSSWNNRYYQSSDDAYAKDNTERRPEGQSRIRNLRWEGGQYVPRPKHYVQD